MAGPRAAVGAAEGPAAWFADALGDPVAKESFVSSSSWSSAYAYTTESGARYFVKTSLGRGRAMFDAEAAGLRALRAAAGDGLVIPDVLHVGVLASVPGGRGLGGGAGSFIVMEHLDLGAGRGASQRALGEGLARLHLAPPSDARAAAGSYGFAMDNTIGATHQPNAWCDDWVSFFRERRLNHMLALLNRPSLNTPGKKVAGRLDALFAGITVRPSLIHGDLWSGNIANVDGGRWSILDPAAYYGHHEAEFGMSWCANFGPEFWAGYRSLIPEDPGFRVRLDLYKSYHIMNHAVLFGSSYLGEAENLLARVAAEL